MDNCRASSEQACRKTFLIWARLLAQKMEDRSTCMNGLLMSNPDRQIWVECHPHPLSKAGFNPGLRVGVGKLLHTDRSPPSVSTAAKTTKLAVAVGQRGLMRPAPYHLPLQVL
jgi:hypothetical protein